jgi:signal transduction histidine kinase
MVKKYGGDVWIDDSDTGGARFVIELARAEGEDRSRESQDHPGPTVEKE